MMAGSRFYLAGGLLVAGLFVAPHPGFADHTFFSSFFGGRSHDTFGRIRSRSNDNEHVNDEREAHSHGVRDKALPSEPTVALQAKDLEAPVSTDSYSAGIFRHLSAADGNAVCVRKNHRDAIIAFYKDRGFQPLWTGGFGLNLRAKRLLALLGNAEEEGLRPSDYLPGSLAGFEDDAAGPATSPGALAKLDLELTVVALEYAHHASAGRIKPIRISEMHTIKIDPVRPEVVLRKLRSTVRPDNYLTSLHPAFSQYRYLKAALARHQSLMSEQGLVEIPDGPMIRPARRDPHIPLVRKRLTTLGLYSLPSSRPPAPSDHQMVTTQEAFYDPDLVSAVKEFQAQSGLLADGIVGPKTRRALNGQPRGEQVRKILLSMERLRWLPADLKQRYIFVNQAAFQTWLVDDGEIVFRSDVIVGKPKYQSAVFVDEMEYVVFNPYWTVPRSMAVDQMLPKLQYDPGYLARQGYELISPGGRKTSWRWVDWYEYNAKNLTYSFRQPPGPKNALGGLKFMFPNSHSIYMHDTPARNLFESDVRAFSYGCVRVKRAYDLAAVVLDPQGWTPDGIAAAIRSGKNQRIELKAKIPVYLGYYTAWADADGGVQFKDDIYGRDRILAQALGLTDGSPDGGKLAYSTEQ